MKNKYIKYIVILVLALFTFIPSTKALEENIVNIHLFYSKVCPHCAKEIKVINELEIQFLDLELVGESENNKSIVKFYVNKYRNADEDNDSDLATIVPFSVAYAVSIHKSQGLEYNSVKIIITNEIDELITHSIFYTSITRAKEKLKIYWSPECQNKIISTIKHIEDNKDVNLIKNKINPI